MTSSPVKTDVEQELMQLHLPLVQWFSAAEDAPAPPTHVLVPLDMNQLRAANRACESLRQQQRQLRDATVHMAEQMQRDMVLASKALQDALSQSRKQSTCGSHPLAAPLHPNQTALFMSRRVENRNIRLHRPAPFVPQAHWTEWFRLPTWQPPPEDACAAHAPQ